MPNTGSSQRHPFLSLLLLLLLSLGGVMLMLLIWAVLALLIYGPDALLASFRSAPGANSTGMLKILQIASSIGVFIVPAFVFARLESNRPLAYLKISARFTFAAAVLAVVIVFLSSPLIEYSVLINKAMKLPAFLQGVEHWMQAKEAEMKAATELLLTMKTPGELYLNLFMIAVLPAIGEELFFRAGIQQVLARWIKNPHIAILITAIVFSAIHVQFYGFIPRMLLGLLLGYLYHWGKNIALPILAHFTNNAMGVTMAYFYQQRGKSLDEIDQPVPGNVVLYLASLAITVALLFCYYKITYREKLSDSYGE